MAAITLHYYDNKSFQREKHALYINVIVACPKSYIYSQNNHTSLDNQLEIISRFSIDLNDNYFINLDFVCNYNMLLKKKVHKYIINLVQDIKNYNSYWVHDIKNCILTISFSNLSSYNTEENYDDSINSDLLKQFISDKIKIQELYELLLSSNQHTTSSTILSNPLGINQYVIPQQYKSIILHILNIQNNEEKNDTNEEYK